MCKDCPKTRHYYVLTPLCRLYELNARIGRMSLDEPEGEEGLDA